MTGTTSPAPIRISVSSWRWRIGPVSCVAEAGLEARLELAVHA